MDEIYDTACPSGNHVYGFNPVAAYFELDCFSRIDVSLPDKSPAVDNDGHFPLRVMPGLTLRYTAFEILTDI